RSWSDVIECLWECDDAVAFQSDNQGNTVLHEAVLLEDSKILTQLLTWLVRKNLLLTALEQTNQKKETVWHLVCQSKNPKALLMPTIQTCYQIWKGDKRDYVREFGERKKSIAEATKETKKRKAEQKDSDQAAEQKSTKKERPISEFPPPYPDFKINKPNSFNKTPFDLLLEKAENLDAIELLLQYPWLGIEIKENASKVIDVRKTLHRAQSSTFFRAQPARLAADEKAPESSSTWTVETSHRLLNVFFWYATHCGAQKEAELLWEKGADFSSVNESGWNAILWAASSGDIKTLKWCLDPERWKGTWVEKRGGPYAITTNDGSNVLLLAIFSGNLKMLEDLEKAGLSLDNLSTARKHPVSAAIRSGNPKMVAKLLKSFSLEEVVNYHTDDPFLVAAEQGYPLLLENLKKKMKKKNFPPSSLKPLLLINSPAANIAAFKNHLDVLSWLKKIQLESFSFFPDKRSQLATLISAVIANQVGIVEWLIEDKFQADWQSTKDDYGNDLVLLTTGADHLEMLKWLVERKGLPLNSRNKQGRGAVLMAARYGCFEILKWLIEEKKLSLNDMDSAKSNVVLAGARSGNLALLKWLIDEKNLSLSTTDAAGNTPCLMASQSGNVDMMEWLINEKNNLYLFKNQQFPLETTTLLKIMES
ncbi:ankyrin repeat domain-containing T4SS effector AnkP, partial [Coxiella burnetii]